MSDVTCVTSGALLDSWFGYRSGGVKSEPSPALAEYRLNEVDFIAKEDGRYGQHGRDGQSGRDGQHGRDGQCGRDAALALA